MTQNVTVTAYSTGNPPVVDASVFSVGIGSDPVTFRLRWADAAYNPLTGPVDIGVAAIEDAYTGFYDPQCWILADNLTDSDVTLVFPEEEISAVSRYPGSSFAGYSTFSGITLSPGQTGAVCGFTNVMFPFLEDTPDVNWDNNYAGYSETLLHPWARDARYENQRIFPDQPLVVRLVEGCMAAPVTTFSCVHSAGYPDPVKLPLSLVNIGNAEINDIVLTDSDYSFCNSYTPPGVPIVLVADNTPYNFETDSDFEFYVDALPVGEYTGWLEFSYGDQTPAKTVRLTITVTITP